MRLAKRVILIALALLAVPIMGGGDSVPQKYLVATRSRPSRALTGALGKSGAAVVTFRSVNGFAASLTDAEVEALRSRSDVLFVEKDPPRYLFDDTSAVTASRATSESSTQQIPYGLILIKAPSVWSQTRGTGVKVGIVDTGIDLVHPDLVPNINGGRSFLKFDESFQDEGSHGTHVSGTVAGADNDFGVVGVAPEAQLYALRVFNQVGNFANASALIEVIDWAIDNGVTILNMSLGGPEFSSLEGQAFTKARQHGIFIAVAVGNTGDGIPQYPAAYPEAFGVGSIDSSYQIAPSSTHGSFVDVVAPGVNVRSTVPETTTSSMLLNDSALGSIEGELLTFSPRGVLTGEWVECGLGRPEDFPSSVAGRVALIQRGDLLFADKAKNAMAAGATAVVIYNNLPGLFSGTLGSAGVYPLTIGIAKEDGEAMLAAGSSVFESSSFQPYGYNSGTSMATPHVAGAAALLRALVPEASTEEIENALVATAHDLGDPGYDIYYGNGVIDVEAAARMLAPERFMSRHRPVRR